MRIPQLPRVRGTRTALEPNEVREVLRAASVVGEDPALNSILIRFHLETAARRCGAVYLTLGDLLPSRGLVNVYQRGGGYSEVPLSQLLHREIVALAVSRGANPSDPTQRAFLKLNGRPVDARFYENLFPKIQECVGDEVPSGVTAHWFRHTTLTAVQRRFGTEWAERYGCLSPQDGDERQANRTISTYTKVTKSELLDLHDALFPMVPACPERWKAMESQRRQEAA